jgi:hypothetical protein
MAACIVTALQAYYNGWPAMLHMLLLMQIVLSEC